MLRPVLGGLLPLRLVGGLLQSAITFFFGSSGSAGSGFGSAARCLRLSHAPTGISR
jgi:hypothetical protein